MRKIALRIALFLGLAHLAYAAELPVSFTAEQVKEAVAAAPELPVDLGFGLTLRLVDFIDFTAEGEFHDFRDRGSSKVVDGPAGKYRQTARHRHAHFSVRWKSAGVDQPHLLVFEYPDDADRQICFFTHDSRLSGKRNLDWSLETGVNCGDPFPVSNQMQVHTMFFWPSDSHPVAMVMNWARNKTGAAASRLWVYAIEDGLPPLDIEEPVPENPRALGTVYNYSKIPRMCVFGGNGPETAFSHMVEYHRFRGDNLIAWPVVVNNSWGFYCTIPAWDGGEGSMALELEQALAVCEKAGMKFLPIINAGFGFKMGGKEDEDSDPAERRALIEKGFTQFIERYGRSPALYGMAFDTQDLSPNYGEAALDQMRKSFGSLAEFKAFMKTLAPDVPLFHFLGGKGIHVEYFIDHGEHEINPGEVLKRWEESDTAWSAHLDDEVKALWTSWNRNPDELNRDGLETILNYQVDDARIFDTYHQSPRAAFYWDMEASAEKSNLIDTRKAMIWNTFYEGYIGLNPHNWYYQKLWVAPDFSPAPPYGLYGQTLAMSHRDRDMMLIGAWGRKGGGIERALREFAAAYRTLPTSELKPLAVKGGSPLFARGITEEEMYYLNVINPTPFAQSLKINERPEALKPFSMITRVLNAPPALSGEAATAYTDWVKSRLKQFKADTASIRAIRSEAVPAAYDRHLGKAERLFAEGKVYAADQALGHGLPRELDTRLAILQPRELGVPRIQHVPALGTPLDRWPAEAADWQTDDGHIATHLFFPGQWDGKDDLSARFRCAHDGETLAFGIKVSDQDRHERDGAVMHFSGENYLTWVPQLSPYEITLPILVPAGDEAAPLTGPFGLKGTVRLVDGGYEIAMHFDVKQLPLGDDQRIGWVFSAGDDDENSSAKPNGWARKQALLFPNDPLYQYWNDARTCAELVLE